MPAAASNQAGSKPAAPPAAAKILFAWVLISPRLIACFESFLAKFKKFVTLQPIAVDEREF
jgi:hypothetical protein